MASQIKVNKVNGNVTYAVTSFSFTLRTVAKVTRNGQILKLRQKKVLVTLVAVRENPILYSLTTEFNL